MISTLFEVLQLITLVLTALFLVVAVEYRRLSFAIISFAVGNLFLSIAFAVLGAPLVAVFNATVFSGAVAILFLSAMNLETPPGDDSDLETSEVAEQ
jgi:NADH:ubiquinone oxidoreductase subunit 6 (subunit J)